MITSISNAQVKQVCAYVQKAKERRKDGIFVVEGPKMFEEAPADRIYKVYVTQSFCDRHKADHIHTKLSETGFEMVSDEVLAKMSDTKTPQGILCLVKWPDHTLTDLLKKNDGVFVVLEDLQDPGNLGTIIHMIGGILGMGIMLTLTLLGALEYIEPVNMFLYQLVWIIPGLLITEWTRSI